VVHRARSELAQPRTRPAALGRRIFLIRHADASSGSKDPDGGRHLTDLGRRQAQALARRIAHWQVDVILCSDKHRARETAAAIHAFHPDIPMIVDATFREASRRRVTAHERGDPEEADLPERLRAAWEKAVSTAHEVTLLVAHNGLIKYFLGRTINSAGVLKPRFHCTETGITGIQLRPQGPLLEFFNDTHHLTPELVTPGSKVPWMEKALRRRE
jgi:broad specificity phosphatase PhoE